MAILDGGADPQGNDQSRRKHHTNLEITANHADEDEDYCPIEQVKMTVSTTDDPTMPVLTFRTWFLGLISCVMLAFVNQFFGYRQNSLYISPVAAQIVTLPLGKFMARVLPTKTFHVPLTNWSLSLNPGPFNLKEHVLITIFASCGASGVYAVRIITIVKAFYHRQLHPFAAWLLVQSTQMLGYGWAGLFRKILVESPFMWWPENMISVSLFRALHEKETRPKGGLSRLQFFIVVFVASFAYYLIPAYFFPSISAISVACLIWKDSILPQQIGSGLHGLGIGSFSLDWSAVVGFISNPISSPGFAIVNSLVGFFLVMYVMTPLTYWLNVYDAQKFPIFSSHTFDHTGQPYNISRVLNPKTFDLVIPGYEGYSKLYLSVFFAFTYGLGFASLAATVSHVGLFHGKTIWSLWSKARDNLHGKIDVHTRLMKKYDQVPNWWFYAILVAVFSLGLYACEGFDKQLQLPWWGLIMACVMAFFFTLPVGIIQATTNQQIGLNIITEMVIGYVYPGRPLANVAFKTYGYISMAQTLGFLTDFKLGHYMKIPPKSMFIIQLTGTVVASCVCFSTSWWLLESVQHICQPSLLPDGSPWTCPGDDVFYNASIIWGVIGPLRMFTSHGVYGAMNWWFVAGALAPVPVYLLTRMYPEKKWIRLINAPLILGATMTMPPARSVNFIMWGIAGIYFNIYIFRVHKKWWARHAYILAASLNAGIAFMAVLLFFSLQSYGVNGPKWWGLDADDHCPLATCPTAPGVVVEGCPVH